MSKRRFLPVLLCFPLALTCAPASSDDRPRCYGECGQYDCPLGSGWHAGWNRDRRDSTNPPMSEKDRCNALRKEIQALFRQLRKDIDAAKPIDAEAAGKFVARYDELKHRYVSQVADCRRAGADMPVFPDMPDMSGDKPSAPGGASNAGKPPAPGSKPGPGAGGFGEPSPGGGAPGGSGSKPPAPDPQTKPWDDLIKSIDQLRSSASAAQSSSAMMCAATSSGPPAAADLAAWTEALSDRHAAKMEEAARLETTILGPEKPGATVPPEEYQKAVAPSFENVVIPEKPSPMIQLGGDALQSQSDAASYLKAYATSLARARAARAAGDTASAALQEKSMLDFASRAEKSSRNAALKRYLFDWLKLIEIQKAATGADGKKAELVDLFRERLDRLRKEGPPPAFREAASRSGITEEQGKASAKRIAELSPESCAAAVKSEEKRLREIDRRRQALAREEGLYSICPAPEDIAVLERLPDLR
jgi:hypothetical protein